MITQIRKVAFLIALICLFAFSIKAQFQNKGKLNAWTTSLVSRNYEIEDYAADLCHVRIAKHKGFDRIVFEFYEGRSRYIIEYLPADIIATEEGDKKINLAGKALMTIYFYSINASAQENCQLKPFPENKLKFPVLKQIKLDGYFEGISTFLIGVDKKMPFRVQELTNPSRLVIDFKH